MGVAAWVWGSGQQAVLWISMLWVVMVPTSSAKHLRASRSLREVVLCPESPGRSECRDGWLEKEEPLLGQGWGSVLNSQTCKMGLPALGPSE